MSALAARHEFDREMARLYGLRFAPGDTETHWEALQDVPLVVLKAAIGHAQRTRVEFPTPYELRQDADIVKAHVAVEEPLPSQETALAEPKHFLLKNDLSEVARTVTVTREWTYYCDDCSDTGMRSYHCGTQAKVNGVDRQPWLVTRQCDRRGEHGGHEWAGRCQCWDTNPALIRKRENQAKYAASAATKGRS